MRSSEIIQQKIESSRSFKEILAAVNSKQNAVVTNCIGAGRAFYVASLFKSLQKRIFCIWGDEESAKNFYDDIIQILVDGEIQFFPAIDKNLWSELGPPSTIIGRRLQTIKSLLFNNRGIIITSAEALLEKIASPTLIQENARKVTINDFVDFDEFIAHLMSLGYTREMKTERPGEMSVRGGIVDVFPLEEEYPFRIEFNGDVIESIRTFDPETQRSLSSRDSAVLIPLGAAGLYGPYIDQPVDRKPLSATLFDYIADEEVIITFDSILLNKDLSEKAEENKNRFLKFCEIHNLTQEIQIQEFYCETKTIISKLNNYNMIDFQSIFSFEANNTIDCNMRKSGQFGGNLSLFKKEIELLERQHVNDKSPFYILLACESQSQAARMKDLLQQENISPRLQIITLNVGEGFLWPDKNIYLFTNRELYGRSRSLQFDRMRQRALLLEEVAKLKENDFVVHVDYGVGIFRGLQVISTYGRNRECIKIEYADGDMLYVPLEKMDRVQKYSSREGYSPTLNKLGTKNWQKIKAKTKQKVKDIAKDLIKLYAKRKMSPGFSFSPDTIWQKELEASFPYEDTVDQLNAVEEIKRDMEAPIPMDRLICGDVGFGKTEVAIRAAFKALVDGKQVAVLVPTTILAQQHYNTFCERMNRFPVKIEVLSRFKTLKQQKEIVKKLADGEIDLIIGTHRLLGKDVRFKSLGLLIIDEEHKFGVIHKEKLKLLKANIDTITLSATPIPRTMHMGLIGVRDLSVINTPPQNRQTVQTEVCRFDKELIREIILKECARGGQVFFIHNRVGTIYAMTQLLRELVPEITIATAHGQMPAHELEKIMLKYMAGEIQCLVTTLIVESGLDIPNANTLIVNRADKLGLSQLYQLRGRVGRSNQKAYAYFLVPPLKKLTKNAIRRLQTIQEFSYLGSGYKIAMRDLEIRGAGNIFGAEQSGFINVLGFELYSKIIEEAIQELRGELISPQTKEALCKEDNFEARIELVAPALLPEDYVPLVEDRVDIYRRLIESKDETAVQSIAEEIRDRFGSLPMAAENLIDYIVLKKLARKANVEEITFQDNIVIGKFNSQRLPKGEQFLAWIGKIVGYTEQNIEFKQVNNQLLFELKLLPDQSAIKQVRNFLQKII